MTRCARPSGSPFAARPVCPTGCAATQPIPGPRPFGARASSVQKRSRRFCVEPRSGVLIPPVGWLYVKKKPVLSYELFLEYGGEGGIDSLRSPFGQPVRCAPGLSNWLRQLSNPGRWFSSPLGLGDTYKQKARTSVQALNLNMAVRGGLTRCARPSGSPFAARPVCPTGCASCRTPVGGSHPPLV